MAETSRDSIARAYVSITGATSDAVGADGGAGMGSGAAWLDGGVTGIVRGAAIPCCTVGCEMEGCDVVTGGAVATEVVGAGAAGGVVLVAGWL